MPSLALPAAVHLLATTKGGLEGVAAAELEEQFGREVDVHHHGVVEFDGNREGVYDLHSRSRTCHRVLEVLVAAPLAELADVYDH